MRSTRARTCPASSGSISSAPVRVAFRPSPQRRRALSLSVSASFSSRAFRKRAGMALRAWA